jgi:8-oxo-dGTP diphosphatase
MSGTQSWHWATIEAARSGVHFDEVLDWLRESPPTVDTPIAVEVWVLSPDLARVLLVSHPWRGWVPPGGKVEVDEQPREAARRELREEAGIDIEISDAPAVAAVRSFKSGWSETLALSYWAVSAVEAEVLGEEGQPAEWKGLAEGWESYFPDDAVRIAALAERLRATNPRRVSRGSATSA